MPAGVVQSGVGGTSVSLVSSTSYWAVDSAASLLTNRATSAHWGNRSKLATRGRSEAYCSGGNPHPILQPGQKLMAVEVIDPTGEAMTIVSLEEHSVRLKASSK